VEILIFGCCVDEITESRANMKRTAITLDTVITTLTIKLTGFLLKLSSGSLVAPEGPFGNCNRLFPG